MEQKDSWENPPNDWKLKSIFLNSPEIRGEIKIEIRKYFELNEDENTACQSWWNATAALLKGDF